MGGISKLISALPGGDKAMAQGQVDTGALDRTETIIFSMTKARARKARAAQWQSPPAHRGRLRRLRFRK